MAKRQKQSAVEDVMNWISRLPWWVGFGMAAVIYGALHTVSSLPMPAAKTPEDIAQLATGAILRGLAYAGQFVLPFLCVMGALLSAVRRRERSHLPNDVGTANSSAQALQGMSWQAFEKLVGEGFRRRGYMVQEQGETVPTGGGPDPYQSERDVLRPMQALEGPSGRRASDPGTVRRDGRTRGFRRFRGDFRAFHSRSHGVRQWPQHPAHRRRRIAATHPGDGNRSQSASVDSLWHAGRLFNASHPASTVRSSLPKMRTRDDPANGQARRVGRSVILGCSVYPSCRGTRHD